MDKNHITELLAEYLDRTLDEIDRKKVEDHLKACTPCTKELEELKTLFNAFEQEERGIPSDTVKTNFFELLEREKQSVSKVVTFDASVQNRWGGTLLKVAASVVLLIGAFLFGKYQQETSFNKEIAVLKVESQEIKQTAMLSLIGNKSASKRIQGVNYIEEFTDPDETIVNALADRMVYDENSNVRLTAAEALGKFTASETVKNAFINALKNEKDPTIQIAIIRILVEIQEKKAVIPMQRLLEREETQPFVKAQIKSLLPSII
ncbi:MAG: HEAT repeat domain-containing protein [Saonia sp.]